MCQNCWICRQVLHNLLAVNFGLKMTHSKYNLATLNIARTSDVNLHKPPQSSNVTFLCPANVVSVYLLNHTFFPLSNPNTAHNN